MKNRIVYVFTSCRETGPTQVMYNVIRHLDRDLFEPILVTIYKEQSDSVLEKLNEVCAAHYYCKLSKIDILLRKTRPLLNLLKSLNPSVVHTVGVFPDYAVSCMKLGCQIITLHNFAYDDYPRSFGQLRGKILINLQMKAASKATKAIACSRSLSDLYHDRDSILFDYICNGIDLSQYHAATMDEKIALRKMLNLPLDKKIFVYSASFISRKNQGFLMDIFANEPKLEETLLLLLGDGPDYAELRGKYGNSRRIEMRGKVTNVGEYLQASDAYISSSLSEGMPNGVLEAMATGLPVVLSDIPQHREIFDYDENIGKLYHQGDREDCVRQIYEMIQQGYDEMGIRALENVTRNFSAEEMSGRYQEEYLDIIARNKTTNKKCKVAECISTIADGGAETIVKDYALMIDKENFQVVIIVLRRSPNTANDRILEENGIRIIPVFKHIGILWKLVQNLNRWWYAPFVLNMILKREKIEVLHAHLGMVRFLGLTGSRTRGLRLFYTCHNEPRCSLEKPSQPDHRAVKKLIKENDMQIIALHEEMRKEINTIFGIDNTVIIRNGIDFRRFQNIPESKDEIRQSLEIPKEAYVLGHIGRFSKQKNHKFLIDVFEEVSKKKSGAFLLLIGTGNLIDDVKRQIESKGLSERVLILSHRSDVPRLLKAMDVFVFPSFSEGLGIVLIEAQISGLRCIVSDAVPREAYQTKLAIPMSLNDPPSKWCDVILDESARGPWEGDINQYDMNKEIKRLESLYMGEREV